MIRSWLYCPGDAPGKILNAGVYGADGLVLDLEDSVGAENKDQARILVAEALKALPADGPRAVRINGMASPWWEADLRSIVPAGARILRIPKVDRPDDLSAAIRLLDRLEADLGLPSGAVRVQCILETPLGVENAFAVACAGGAERVEALCFGAEDYCAAVGLDRPGPDFALDYPRSRVAAAAASAGIPCYDTVWADFGDAEGLERDARRARDLGFSGKSVIHPDQIAAVHRVFAVTPEQRAWAVKVLAGGDGAATAVDGAMVDAPVRKRAARILERAGNGDA